MLYSRPNILTPILLAQKEAYLQHLAAALSNPVKLGRHALIAHVNFITGSSSTTGSFATEVDAPTSLIRFMTAWPVYPYNETVCSRLFYSGDTSLKSCHRPT